MWPSFKLTAAERRAGATKYGNPSTGAKGCRRSIYYGALQLSETQRQPSFSFRIARRSRVIGMTASGDLPQFLLQLSDSSGEQYFADYISATNLFGGYCASPGGVYYPNDYRPNSTNKAPSTNNNLTTNFTAGPKLFEPNIVLRSNQTLLINGAGVRDFSSNGTFSGVYQIDICLHVVEFYQQNIGMV
jgi:hypothetical protein